MDGTPPGLTVVAVDENDVVGTAKMGPNRGGRGAHIATASFMVNLAAQRLGTGRALGQFTVDWARTSGYHGMQFNAVVETNATAVRLWESLGFDVLATVPEAFDPPHGKARRTAPHVPTLLTKEASSNGTYGRGRRSSLRHGRRR